MKKLALFIVLALFIQSNLSSQPCLPEGIAFTAQEEIDNFQTNYPNCTEIEGDVTISGDGITNLNGLSVLTSIGGTLWIGDSEGNNYSLASLLGLDNLTSIGGSLWIGHNMALTSLTGLEGLTSIGGNITIGGNNALISLTGLNNISIINGNLTLAVSEMLGQYSGNLTLTSLTGLEGLESIVGNLWIRENISLPNLTGLESLTSIGGVLSISFNNSMIDFAGIENVSFIGGSIYIGGNDSLINLAGLESLTSIGENVVIAANETLTNLTGLSNVTSFGGNITIINNIALSTCEVQSICNYLLIPNVSMNIHDNAPGCNSQEEVEDACDAVTKVEIYETENYSIFPNPVTDIAAFSSDEITSFELYDLMGEIIFEQVGNTVDMSNLSPGIYFVVGFDNNNDPLYKGKIMKK